MSRKCINSSILEVSLMTLDWLENLRGGGRGNKKENLSLMDYKAELLM